MGWGGGRGEHGGDEGHSWGGEGGGGHDPLKGCDLSSVAGKPESVFPLNTYKMYLCLRLKVKMFGQLYFGGLR